MTKNTTIKKSSAPGNVQADYFVGILGSGFSGLCMAINLKKAGIESFVLLEKAGDVGGTWRENTYPGAACDVPSHLYCFSFEPKADWSRSFAPQPEILSYLRHCADKYAIRPHIQFNKAIVSAVFDDTRKLWTVTAQDGSSYRCSILVSGKGGLHVPAFPSIAGMQSFNGASFHSAEWNHNIDLTGKRVAIIGTGASAIQIVPAIVDNVKELQLYQRTPAWVLPKDDRPYTNAEKLRFKRVPGAGWLHRQKIYWSLEPRVLGFAVNPKLMTLAQNFGKRHINKYIKDPALRKKLTPTYTMGCKRALLSNDYYPALARNNASVISDGIKEIRANSIVTQDGIEREVDVIIYCTGFQIQDFLNGLVIKGVEGKVLEKEWEKTGPEAYLGITTHGFPNLFFLMGPNTGLGHNSMVFMIESQVNYTMEAIKKMRKTGAKTCDVKANAQRKFADEMHERLTKSVWSSGCQSWYINEAGRNNTVWPGFTVEYRFRTRKFDDSKYLMTKA